MAKYNQLGNRGKNLYKDVYSAKRDLKVAKANRVANDVIKRYGDKQTKDLWKLYKKMGLSDKGKYLYDMGNTKYGKYASNGAPVQQMKDAYSLYDLRQELARNMNGMMYKDSAAKNYIDKKYSKRYDMIEDAEDWTMGLSHPVIAYNGNDYLERKKRTKIR